MSKPDVFFYDHKPQLADMAEEVIAGLSARPKRLSPKYFYDAEGSKLFDAITRLPEYYPTRTEISILKRHRDDIAHLLGKDCALIEYGSGSSEKIRTLLESAKPKIYVPLDISKDHLMNAARRISGDYEWLEVHAACVDYSQQHSLPEVVTEMRRAAFFPGSSIGNFDPDEARQFLVRMRQALGNRASLLIGVDLQKSKTVLERAYNDAAGVTAQFNLNVLHHINRELDATIDVQRFEHEAFYNETLGCIQMFLRSKLDQVIQVRGQTIGLAAGELIHTENSFKYTIDQFTELAASAGFKRRHVWTDDDTLFSVFYLET